TDHHLTVETPRSQQGRVEHIRTVGCGNDNDAVIHFETVHLHQQLVEGLLALVMTTAQSGATVATNGVDLVDEDDAGRMLLGLLEHVTHTAGADPDEHFDEIRAGNGEERHLGLTCNGLGQQRLAGTGRADHQHPARNAATEALELARITQELDQLTNLFLGLIAAGNIGQCSLDLILGEQARLGLAEAHGAATAAATALHLAHKKHEHSDDHQNREAGHQQLGPDALPLRLLADDLDVVVDQILDQATILDRRANGLKGRAVEVLATDDVAIDSDLPDLALLHLLDELGIVQLAGLARAGKIVHHRDQDGCDDQPQDQVLCHVVQFATL